MSVRVGAIAKELARGVRRRRSVHRGVRVLAYHGVVEHRTDPRVEESFHTIAELRAHIELLRRLPVVPLDGVEDALRARMRPAVVITFDDGFHNNLLAAELLAAARLPATFFVSSDCVNRGETIWPTVLRLVLARGSARRLMIGGERVELDGDDAAFGRVRAYFKKLPTATRVERWSELVAQLRPGELEELLAAFPSLRMMSWRDVAALRATGFAIGSHGYRHELQHDGQPADLRQRELAASRQQIEHATGHACTAFAFPNGTVNAASAEEARATGYALGFTMVPRAARADDDRMLIPRLLPGGAQEKLAAHLVFGS